jgi:hypothetical protein
VPSNDDQVQEMAVRETLVQMDRAVHPSRLGRSRLCIPVPFMQAVLDGAVCGCGSVGFGRSGLRCIADLPSREKRRVVGLGMSAPCTVEYSTGNFDLEHVTLQTLHGYRLQTGAVPVRQLHDQRLPEACVLVIEGEK